MIFSNRVWKVSIIYEQVTRHNSQSSISIFGIWFNISLNNHTAVIHNSLYHLMSGAVKT